MKLSRPAHQIAEIICPRLFKTKGFKELPPKFWNDPRFSREYRLQLIKANALLKTFSLEAIISALTKTKIGVKIYSLGAKWLDPIIAQEEEKIKQFNLKLEKSSKTQVEPIIEENVPRPTLKTGKSIFDKLD